MLPVGDGVPDAGQTHEAEGKRQLEQQAHDDPPPAADHLHVCQRMHHSFITAPPTLKVVDFTFFGGKRTPFFLPKTI